MEKWFSKFAQHAADWTGRSHTFVLAIVVILVWGVTGPYFAFSDTWQLIINTGTTIVTFLMVFLIQNAQNRATMAMQIKMDEIVRAAGKARNSFIGIEDLTDAELLVLKEHLAIYRTERQATPHAHPRRHLHADTTDLSGSGAAPSAPHGPGRV